MHSINQLIRVQTSHCYRPTYKMATPIHLHCTRLLEKLNKNWRGMFSSRETDIK